MKSRPYQHHPNNCEKKFTIGKSPLVQRRRGHSERAFTVDALNHVGREAYSYCSSSPLIHPSMARTP